MARNLIFVIPISLVVIFTSTNIFAWDNERTHKDISQYAAEKSVLETSNKDYLKNLGYSAGLNEKFILNNRIQSVLLWLQEGSDLEDAGSLLQLASGSARSYNHFHNPLKPWETAGLYDYYSTTIPYPPFYIIYPMLGESALLWAQDSDKQQTYLERKGLQGDQSWQTIRDHYYKALIGQSNVARQAELAQTFKGLGHQMHLLQDMAVPAHVRNDAHVSEALQDMAIKKGLPVGDLYFETYAKYNAGLIRNLASNPVYPQVDFTKSPAGNVPIAQLYDTDQYNENMVPTKSLQWGLSEYANANFVSDDTVFTENSDKKDRHYFPYPRYTDQEQCYEQFDEVILGTNKSTKYWRKKCLGEPVEHFVKVEPWYNVALTWEQKRLSLSLNERAHYDYASNLIPRAVGYSAALLNYFFRGDISLRYVVDPSPGYVIINNGTERMEGEFGIYYDATDGVRLPVYAGKGWIGPNGDKTNPITFNAPGDAADPEKYIVVFRGKMGNEEGAVVGKVENLQTLAISLPSQGYYAMAAADPDEPQFTNLKAMVKNLNSSESLQNGTLQAIAKYKNDSSDTDYIYSKSLPIKIGSISPGQTIEFAFDFSDDPIPVDITDLFIQVVFKGRIGTQSNAMAYGTKDTGEPTPIDLFNDRDMACINGKIYVAGSPEAIAQVDSNHNGFADEWDVYAHNLRNIYVKISAAGSSQSASPNDYTFKVETLDAGQFLRAKYILTDPKFTYSFYNESVPVADQGDRWGHFNESRAYNNGTSVINQGGNISSYYNFRGIEMWWGGSAIFIDLPYPDGSKCPWQPQ